MKGFKKVLFFKKGNIFRTFIFLAILFEKFFLRLTKSDLVKENIFDVSLFLKYDKEFCQEGV